MTRDINGYNAFGITPSYDIEAGGLAANTEQHFTVPANYPNWLAIFSYTPGANIWVSVNGTALAPTGAFASSSSALNPAGRQVKSGDVLSFITADATNPMVSVELQIISQFGN
jgi:hypothetical protein